MSRFALLNSSDPNHAATFPLLRRLFMQYMRQYLPRIGFAMIFMAVAAAMTGAMAKLMQPIIDDVFQQQDRTRLYMVAGAVFLVFAVRGAATFFHSVIMNGVGQRIVADVQNQMYRHLMNADLAFFHANASGSLISRIVNDVNVMRMAMSESLTSSVRSTLTLIGLVFVMFQQDWKLAIAAFVVFPISAFYVARLGKRLRRIGSGTQAELANFSSILGQTFQGARHVKAYGMEEYEWLRVGGIVERLYSLSVKGFRIGALSTPVTEILSGAAIVSVILYGGSQVLSGYKTAGELISFITAFLLAYEPMKRLGKMNAQVQMGLAAAERVFAIIDTPPQIVDRPSARPLAISDYTVKLNNVRFAYSDGNNALEGVSLVIPAGKTVALVGASGAGKSTVLNLIPRFYDVESGAVTIGGVDVRDATLASLRAHIAIVSQEVALFDDTIYANIAYGKPGASKAEIEQAANDAFAHDFILSLPDGYNTMTGELGVKLSGGQRQRIAIARAMLRNAPILLLDEATSALDNESERAVQAALRRLCQGRTTIVVAHRLSTIVDADCIYVLDKGLVAEEGTHAELLAKGGVYSRLYGMQQ